MKRSVTILGGDERMAWLADSLRRAGYPLRLGSTFADRRTGETAA